MDNLQKFISGLRTRLLLILLFNNILLIVDWWITDQLFELEGYWLFAALLVAPVLSVTLVPWLSANYLAQPTKLLWQAILHLAPETTGVPAPNLKSTRLGRELVATLVSHIYQLASVADNVEKLASKKPADLRANFIANSLPLPLLVLDKNETIIFANESLLKYLEQADSEVVGKNVYSVLDMSFPNEKTFDAWLQNVKNNTATAAKTWSRVRLNQPDQQLTLQFDLAAYYNKDNPEGTETIMVLFDHTEAYSQDDQAMSFVALAVHELRTPLTLMRGYIDVFDEELADKLNPEQADFMHKMNASAQQLTTFVNTILNVARIESDQLFVQLQEEKWSDILQNAVNSWKLRAEVRGVTLTCEVMPNLPTVGVDRVAIFEVVSNLIDNAIKYSSNGKTKKIIVKSELTKDGLIETTVQDFGVGIPASVIPNLFTKFYRNHRNRAQIGGTGLGLYLAKAIVTAHGGNIWVRSAEGEGTTFGFTILPYTSLADEQKNSDNKDITRGAHGWIKNHSLYRR